MNILEVKPLQPNMASTLDGNLMWAIGILLIPLLLAVPAKILYQTVILGVGPAERNYRSTVQKILDSGMQVEQFREVLDEEVVEALVEQHRGGQRAAALGLRNICSAPTLSRALENFNLEFKVILVLTTVHLLKLEL